jgi:hypothetical protein
MKKILLVLAIIIVISSAASASVLVTASPLGQGKWGYLLGGQYDMVSAANSNLYGLGGFLGYGVLGNMDVYGKLGYGVYCNLPTAAGSPTSASALITGLALKYTFLQENAKTNPVSVAGLLGYQTTTVTWNYLLGSAQTAAGDIGIGAVVSKVLVPWVPYGALVYHSLNSNTAGVATSGSNIEVAVGTQMLLSKSSAIIGELSYNSFSLGTTYTDTQISIAYSAKI